MREQLIAYLERLFDRAADTPRNRELQEEILQNTLDRYDDLVAQGVPEGTAYGQAVDQLGDVSKLWEAGPKKQGKNRHRWGRLARELNEAVCDVMEEAKTAIEEAGAAVKDAGDTAISRGGRCTVRYAAAETYTGGAASIAAAGITRAKIEWHAGRVMIQPGDDGEITMAEQKASMIRGLFQAETAEPLKPEYQLQWRVRDDTLEIRFIRPGVYLHLPEKALTLTLPRRLASLEVTTVSADLKAESLQAETLKMETVSGDGDISGTLQSLKWHSVSGDLDFEGRASAVKISTVSGDADLELEATPDLLTAELVSGDLELTLPEDRSFRLRCKTVSGDFESELPLTKLGKKEWQFHAAGTQADLQIESVSGDLTLRQG